MSREDKKVKEPDSQRNTSQDKKDLVRGKKKSKR